MKHRARARKLGRSTSHRLAMLRNMVTSLLDHERVHTTDAKAKEVRRVAERMITLGKRGDMHARRRALRVIRRREVAAKVFGELAERYRDRPGGYTRVVKLGQRHGDAAPLSLVELISGETVAEAPAAETKPRRKKAAKAAADKPASKKAPAKKAGGAGKTAGKKKSKSARKPATEKAASKKSPAKKTKKKSTAKKKSGGKAGSRKSSRRKSD